MNPVGNRFHSISKMFSSFEKYQHICAEAKQDCLAPWRPTILIAYGRLLKSHQGLAQQRQEQQQHEMKRRAKLPQYEFQ